MDALAAADEWATATEADVLGTDVAAIVDAAGASVTGVCSTRNIELVRSLGADYIVDHATGGLDGLAGPFDAIIDNVGSLPLRLCKQLLFVGGRYVVVGGPDGGRLLGPLTHLIRAKLAFVTGGRRALPFLAKLESEDLSELARRVAEGTLTPMIERTFGTHEVVDAIRHIETRRTRGKVVITDTPEWQIDQ